MHSPPVKGDLAEDSVGSSLSEAQETGIIIHGDSEMFHADDYSLDDFEVDDNGANTTDGDNTAIITVPSAAPTKADDEAPVNEDDDDATSQQSAAILIQQRARMRTAKKKVEEQRQRVQHRQEVSAATNIQRLTRARNAKKKVAKVRHVKHSSAATKMQAQYRQRAAKKQVAKVRHVKHSNAATKMQAQYRQRAAKKQVDGKRQQRTKERESAIKLQSVTRGGLERKRRKQQKEAEEKASIQLQSLMRSKMAKERVAKIRMRKHIRDMKKDVLKRKQWAGLNKQKYSPYREALSLHSKLALKHDKNIFDRSGGLMSKNNFLNEQDMNAYLLGSGGSSMLSGSESMVEIPLIGTENSTVETEARLEIEAILVSVCVSFFVLLSFFFLATNHIHLTLAFFFSLPTGRSKPRNSNNECHVFVQIQRRFRVATNNGTRKQRGRWWFVHCPDFFFKRTSVAHGGIDRRHS